jgi:hypothetical protein
VKTKSSTEVVEFQATAQEQRFLQLLAAGHTVTDAGKQVGWTYGRANHWLFVVRCRENLRSNYQLVAYAHDHYWISAAADTPERLTLDRNQQVYLELLAAGEIGTTIPPLLFVSKSTTARWMEAAVYANGARNLMQLFGWACALNLVTIPARKGAG